MIKVKALILISLINNILSQSTQCIYNKWDLSDEDNLNKIDQNWNFQDENKYVSFGQGFWIRYLPYKSNYLAQITDEQLNLDIINYFLYSLKRTSDDSQLLFNFIQLNKIEETIHFIVYIYTEQLIIKKIIPIDIFNFEGVWIFLYFYNNYQYNQFYFYYYQSNIDKLYQETFDSVIQIQNTDAISSQIRNFLNTQIAGENIITIPFLGIIKQVENTSNNILQDINYFKQICYVEINCQELNHKFISDTSLLLEQFFFQKILFMFTENNTFKFFGWVKQDKLDAQNKLDSLLMRITINEKYSKDFQIGDKFLYVVYHQNEILSQSGFTAQTYSYTFPYTSTYQTKEDETFTIFDSSLSDQLTQWHFIQYEEGSSINEGKPIYRVYFPINDQSIECKWNNQVHHFSSVNLYFYIGGDDYFAHRFKGSLGNWEIISYCEKYLQSQLEIRCFYTCQTCKGLTAFDCLSCPINSDRIFSPSDNTCSCKVGYIDGVNGYPTCLSISQIHGAFELQVKEISCEKQGFYQCDESQIICELGYFLYKNQCIQCPQFSNNIYSNQLFCGECYLDQTNFQLSLKCSLAFISKNDEAPFYEMWNEIQIYQINDIKQNDYSLKIIEGYQGNNQCKFGYLMNSQGFCQICVQGCYSCLNINYCSICLTSYFKTNDGICKQCQICSECYFENEIEFCLNLIACSPKQYLDYPKCIDCGQYCQQCDYGQCLYCIDNEKYYQSLNRLNCGICSIENCQYCFEYLYQDNKNLIISIDISTDQINLDMFDIQLGCAQCYNGYYFSFETNKCELLNQDMQLCQVGVSLPQSQSITCLKSKFLTTSIQTTNCENSEFCLECIQNYNFGINSFCIVCEEGYYSNIIDGLCKQCPSQCKTCAQQNIGMNNYWKQQIKAFYFHFANQNGQHQFEIYAVNSNPDSLEIICFTCKNSYIIHKNQCIEGCSEICEDCRIVDYDTNIYRSHCYKCQSNIYNKVRSFKFEFPNQFYEYCEVCPKYCQACYAREIEEIASINKYFDLSTSYRKYSFKCYRIQNKESLNIYISPKMLAIQSCQNFQKCSKTVDINFKVFRTKKDLNDASQLQTNQTLLDRYIDFASMMSLYKWMYYEDTNFVEYYNQELIEEINVNYYMQHSNDSEYWQLDEFAGLRNRLKYSVFLLKNVNLKIQGEDDISFICYKTFMLKNFDNIILENINFYAPNTNEAIQFETVIFTVKVTNDYYPMSLKFKNVNFFQSSQNNSLDFNIICNRPKSIQFINVELTLNLTNSVFLNYEPFEDFENSNFYVDNFKIQNNLLSNVTIFQFQATNNSLNCTIIFKKVTILNAFFSNNSSFIYSSFDKNYDIGIIQLEDFLLKDVTFENSSVFLRFLSSQRLHLRNFTLFNVKFFDTSSFLIANTFTIYQMKLQQSIIQFGYFISNIGKFSESKQVRYHSELLSLEGIIFQDNKYFKENLFIYIVQDQVKNISLIIKDFEIYQHYLYNSQIGKPVYNFATSQISQMYLECNYCYLNNLTMIRGLGYPELTISNSKYLSIVNLNVKANPTLQLKLIHTSINCIKQFYSLDLPYIIYIQSFHQVILDSINIFNNFIIDYPFIQIIGKRFSDQNEIDQINVTNSFFESNNLIITQFNRFSAIIQIETSLNMQIEVRNVTFIQNLLYKFEDDLQLHSSSTMIIDSYSGQVLFENVRFLSNMVLNSSDSNLFIKTDTLIILGCLFDNQNIPNYRLVQQYILFDIIQTDQEKIISNTIVIYSIGGSGQFYVNSLIIQKSNVTNSFAVNGGAFYIVVKSVGILQIQNSTFENTSTLLDGNQFSSGGTLYIDASKSRLILQISNSIIKRAYSRTQGGAIYIEASRTLNEIYFNNLSIENAFSLQHSILSYYPYKLSSLSSNILINNSFFSSSEFEFNNYLSKIQDLSIQDVQPFQNNNPSIYVQFSNFSILNTKFYSIHLSFLIQIQNGINVNLINIYVQNTTIFNSPLFRIILREDINAQLIVQNLYTNFIQQFQFEQNLNCTPENIQQQNKYLCPINASTIISSPNINFQEKNTTNQLNCNKNLIYTSSQNNISLFELKQISKSHHIILDDIQFTQCNCSNCYFGLISIQELSFIQLNLKINSMTLQNNICGTLGCLSILNTVENNLLSTLEPNRILTEQDLGRLEFQQIYKFQVKIQNSKFYNNTAYYGGACYFSSVNILLDNCKIKFNIAYKYGGGIFVYSNNTSISIINSQIVNNQANIAGGIYLKNDQLQSPQKLNFILKANNANITDNSYETPCQLRTQIRSEIIENSINLFKNSTTIIDQVQITSYQTLQDQQYTTQLYFPTGISISSYKYFDASINEYQNYNLSFRILAFNTLGEQIKYLNGSMCSIFAQEISTKSENYFRQIQLDLELSKKYLSKTKIQFNETTQDYNLNELIIYFNPLKDQDLQLLLIIQCDQIKVPQYNQDFPYEKTHVINDYFLLITLKTFKCQLGEYLNQASGGCVECDISYNQYSVTIDAVKCQFKNDIYMKSLQPAKIELREGYWRAYYYSNKIEECYHLKLNCLGGWSPGDKSCTLGHIGALCEQCDLYDIQGNGAFSQGQSYTCSSCKDMAGNIANITFALIWTILSVFLSVNSTITMIEEFILYTKMKTIYRYLVFKSSSTSVLIKVFTNYLQIIGSISKFQLSIPIGIVLTFKSIGNPIETMSFSLDCYLSQMASIPIHYLRILWGFFLIACYIFLFIGMHLLILFYKKKKLSMTFITTTLIYIYIYLSPNLISGLVTLLSYRIISDIKWITGNVAYQYDTTTHYIWLFSFTIPAFIIIGVLLPIFFWFIVYYHRNRLNETSVRKLWGYLYNEYKLNTYFWETIKILQKECIIYILIYYEDYVAIKASLILIVFLIYGKLTNQYKPYQTGDLNQIDALQTSICNVSIILAQIIFTAQTLEIQEIVLPSYTILAILNFYFVVKVIIKIVFAYFNKLEDQIDEIKIYLEYKFPKAFRKNQFCLRYLKSNKNRKQIIRQRFQLIKQFLLKQARQLIQYKVQTEENETANLSIEKVRILTDLRFAFIEQQTTNSRINTQKKQIRN